jgi:uncharacterized protein
MYCPVCSTSMRAVERQGIALDFCPQCKGLWLDQGELDELIRREAIEAVIEGQGVLVEKRNARSFDHIDRDAPPPALLLSEVRR